MAGTNVVIVESPAKAKTINKYLGPEFRVVASYGHIRDLPAKDGSVRPDDDFAMSWTLADRGAQQVEAIAQELQNAQRLYLATDPDREGEAISWHVREVLAERAALEGVDVARITFNEITQSAVRQALQQPRGLDEALIQAYLARRALDYLVGFTLSPVLWRKLPGSKSAGRVQSVALRLIGDREAEIEAFEPQEYWTVQAQLATADGDPVGARVTHLDGEKLPKQAIGDRATAHDVARRLESADLQVASLDTRTERRNPQPPFTTSTLQQDASRKLGFGASKTMTVAQQLYEGVDLGGEQVGLITYMRTDGVNLAQEAIDASRKFIAEAFGSLYVPKQPRIYKSTAKNAQEAHEAIRPTDVTRRPEAIAGQLTADQRKLYELIWKRTIACEMASAQVEKTRAEIRTADGAIGLRATGQVVTFDGFLAVYQEGKDEDDKDDGDRRLPPLAEGQKLRLDKAEPEQHFTQPPPRYTEASLVKTLEEKGIGRPSTYAQIIQVLQDRGYVELSKRRFVPTDRGRLVNTFLTSFFERYVQDSFTAELENQLDDIAAGKADWKDVLRQFWDDFRAKVDEAQGLSMGRVIEVLDEALAPHFFRPSNDNPDPRGCPSCDDGRLALKLGRFGPFIGCSNYPDCRYTRPLTASGEESGEGGLEGPRELGEDPETGLPVTVRRGPYGPYVQLGPSADAAEAGGKSKKAAKPAKRVTVPPPHEPAGLDLNTALALLALPRELGGHPDDGEAVLVGVGRYGPYVRHGSRYVSLPKDEDVLAVGMNRAVALLAESKKGKAAAGPLAELGAHPEDGQPVTLHKGRFGPYVKHGKTNASLPKDADPEQVTLDQAVELLQRKAAKAGSGGPAAKSGGGAKKSGAGGGKSGGSGAKASTGKAGQGQAKSSAAKSSGSGKKSAKSGSPKTGGNRSAKRAGNRADGPAGS